MLRHPMVDNDSARHTMCAGLLPVQASMERCGARLRLPLAFLFSGTQLYTECLVHRGGGAASDEQCSKLVRKVHLMTSDFKAAVWTRELPQQTLPSTA